MVQEQYWNNNKSSGIEASAHARPIIRLRALQLVQ